MKELKIKFIKEYGVDTDNSNGEPCHCCLTLVLPEDEDGALIPILRDRNSRIFGEVLSSRWGGWSSRTATITIESTNWDRLSKLVNERINGVIEILKEVKEKNEHLSATKPENETIIMKI